MAASGLDHLKNNYRRRFCRPSRRLDINTEQGQNILEILQDYFEEQSLASDISADSPDSVLHSTPKTEDQCIQSSSKQVQCQNSHPESVPVSSRKKQDSLQAIAGPSETVNGAGQTYEVVEKSLATNAASQNIPSSRKISKNHRDHNEADVEFHLPADSPIPLGTDETAPQSVQRRSTYTFENSVNMLCSSTELSLKTKKRLNFEDKSVLKKLKMEDEITEGSQRKKPSLTSQERLKDSEYKTQPPAKKSFSTLLLEVVKKKSGSGSFVKHITTAPPHSTPANDMKLLEDEFIIDTADGSFTNRSWITIPRRSRTLKQSTVSPTTSTEHCQSKKSREKHHSSSPRTLTCDKPCNSQSAEKSQPSEQEILSESCVLTDEMENNNRSAKSKTCSENMERPPGNKRTRKQKQRRKCNTTAVEEQADLEQPKDKNVNMSLSTQGRLQGNSDRNVEECKETENASIMGSNKSGSTVPHTKNSKNTDYKKKQFSDRLQKNKLSPGEVTLASRRSKRISRLPSDWWVVKPENTNELSEYDKMEQKSSERTNWSSKNVEKNATSLKRQKRTTQGNSKKKKSPNTQDSGGITDHHEAPVCSQDKLLKSDEANLTKEKNVTCSGDAENRKDKGSGAIAETVQRKSRASGCTHKTPPESNLDPKDCNISGFQESGPSLAKNYLMFRDDDSDGDDRDIHQYSDDSEVNESKIAAVSKKHHKLVLPSNTPNVRRTKRIRLKPLEYWRGERIDYHGRPSGGFVIGGILSPDTVASKRKTKENPGKANKIINRKKICLDHDEKKTKLAINLNIPLGDPLQPTRVKDPETREFVLMDLVRPRDTYQFFIEHSQLKVYKTLDTPFFSTGKLILGPHQEKGKQHVGSDTLIFYVNFGDLLCILHETPYVITTGDSFYVPAGNYYNIRNLLNEESVLLFTQIKR